MTIIWLFGTLLAAMNIAVSFFVARSELFSRGQKLSQCALIWFIPVLGCVGVGVFLYSQRDNPLYDTRAYPEPAEKANLAILEPVLSEIEASHEP